MLPGCLRAVHEAAARAGGTPVHIVVVADDCDDATAIHARRGGAKTVEITSHSVGAAREAGIREVLRITGHLDPAAVWLATTDADSVVPANWLIRQLRLANEGWEAVVGTISVTDWSGHPPGVRVLFEQRYRSSAGDHSHVHGANLGFTAKAYLTAGGFPSLRTAEDHALVNAFSAAGSRVLRTTEVNVVTSARRRARAPRGFSHLLRALDFEGSGVQIPRIGDHVPPDLAERNRAGLSRADLT